MRALFLLCGVGAAGAANYTILQDTDFAGNKVGAKKVSTFDECAQFCLTNEACVCVSWNGPDSHYKDNNCNLHCSAAGQRTDKGELAAIIRPHMNACGPPPSPPSPTPSSTFECVVKQQSMLYASRLTGGRSDDHVFDALGFPSGCPRPKTPARHVQGELAVRKAVQVFVSPRGSVLNDGLSETSPVPTLHAARDLARRLKNATTGPVTIRIMRGRHIVEEAVTLGPEDSGEPGRPVVWRGEEGSVVSGGVDLSGLCKWTKVGAVLQCKVPASAMPEEVQELFINGERKVRARYPNGNPLVPKDGYIGGCRPVELLPYPTEAYDPNCTVLSKNGTQVANISFPASTITVSDAIKPRAFTGKSQTLYKNTRFNETYSNPFFNDTTLRQARFTNPAITSRMANWSSPGGAVVKMFHPYGWGSWAFEVESVDGTTLTFKRGGNQEGDGGVKCGNYYIENVKEELDAPGEWFYDRQTSTLYFYPETQEQQEGLLSGSGTVGVPKAKTIWSVMGESPERPAHDMIFENVNVTQVAPTYLDDYEVPSGGDWSIHRGAAVFIHNAERVGVHRVKFDQIGGNGVFFSTYVRDSNVTDCDFWLTGDTAVLLVGTTRLGDGRAPTYPKNTLVSGNWMDTVGFYMKQTSCVFKSMSYRSVIQNNLCYNGPRAGINFNDAFMGGDVLEGNLIFNMVRETGDHGTFNSWDRREWVFSCPSNPAELCFVPETTHLRNNMFIGPAGWNVDHDDGSSYYWDYNNTVYQGHFKYRDGDVRNVTGNLMIEATPAFQVAGFAEDYFIDNMCTYYAICGPQDVGALSGTVYLFMSEQAQEYSKEGLPPGCDPGTNRTLTYSELGGLIQSLWPKQQ